jgi:hypothetical protein
VLRLTKCPLEDCRIYIKGQWDNCRQQNAAPFSDASPEGDRKTEQLGNSFIQEKTPGLVLSNGDFEVSLVEALTMPDLSFGRPVAKSWWGNTGS